MRVLKLGIIQKRKKISLGNMDLCKEQIGFIHYDYSHNPAMAVVLLLKVLLF